MIFYCLRGRQFLIYLVEYQFFKPFSVNDTFVLVSYSYNHPINTIYRRVTQIDGAVIYDCLESTMHPCRLSLMGVFYSEVLWSRWKHWFIALDRGLFFSSGCSSRRSVLPLSSTPERSIVVILCWMLPRDCFAGKYHFHSFILCIYLAYLIIPLKITVNLLEEQLRP